MTPRATGRGRSEVEGIPKNKHKRSNSVKYAMSNKHTLNSLSMHALEVFLLPSLEREGVYRYCNIG